MIFKILFSSLLSFADPVAIKCGSDGSLLDLAYSVSTLERQSNYLRKFENNNTEAGLCSACKKICAIDEAKNIILQTANITLQTSLNVKLRGASTPLVQIDDNTFSSLKSVEKNYQSNVTCAMSPPMEAYTPDNKLILFYPFNSNWMFVTGCTSLSGKSCEPVYLKAISNVIDESVAMGVDPYAVLAKGFLENGIGGGAELYLDPIGAMDSIGCKGTAVNQNIDNKTLDSYGTYYSIGEQVIDNPQLSAKLKQFSVYRGISLDEKTSYLCRNVLSANGEISDSPQKNSCCLKLSFSNKSEESKSALARGLVYEQIKKTLANRFRDKRDPAFRLQRFNGYTDLMGGAEPVPAFRAGVNFYKDPAYGYQGMDFIINTLMINPAIRALVDEATKKNGPYKSLICSEAGPGSFILDSDYYFNKHRDSKRLESLRDKVLNGKTLTDREQSVLSIELAHPDVQSALTGKKFAKNPETIRSELASLGIKLVTNEVRSFDEVFNNLPEVERKKISTHDRNTLSSLHTKLGKLELRSWHSPNTMEADANKILRELRKVGKSQTLTESLNSSQDFVVDIETLVRDNLSDDAYRRVESEVKRVSLQMGDQKTIANLQEQQNQILRKYGISEGYLFPINYFEHDIPMMMNKSGLTDAQKKDPRVISLFESYVSSATTPGISDSEWPKYFKDIYPKRDTVSKASTYPWRPFTEDELNTLSSSYQSVLSH